ncbi:hypothetical protein [Candidatus Ichthyocystis hellenicum]
MLTHSGYSIDTRPSTRVANYCILS